MSTDGTAARGNGGVAFDCVGFDLDGTLLHTGRELAASLNHALDAGGLSKISETRAIAMIGGGARALVGRALAEQGVTDPAEAEALLPVLLDHYEAHLGEDTDIYPGLVDVLDRLAEARVRLAVVTNKRAGPSRRLLAIKGLADRFACVIGGDTLGADFKKPKPDMLLAMAREMRAERPVFVGDSEYDAGAAKAAGMPFVGVGFGYATEDLAALGAVRVIDGYDELWPLLAG